MDQIGANTKEQLKSIVGRVERLEEEKATLATDIKDIYSEAKANGFDAKALRTIVRLRKEKPEDRANREAVLETYMHALGMV
jgi:uncharacterized protein (UPF0335 family)